jgi:hypothetical protein
MNQDLAYLSCRTTWSGGPSYGTEANQPFESLDDRDNAGFWI